MHEVPGLHTKEGEPTAFHVISARWSDQNGGIIEWFFNGEKVRYFIFSVLVHLPDMIRESDSIVLEINISVKKTNYQSSN